VVCNAGWGLALDRDTCIQILGEGGFVPSHGFIVVSFCDIPDGLNADELEQYLREHGAELRRGPAPILEWTPCEIRGIQTGAPGAAQPDVHGAATHPGSVRLP
jgi:hypothetical protein